MDTECSDKIFKNINSPKKTVQCHFCRRDLKYQTYIFCEQCKCIEICPICFANGKESSTHFKTHDYRVIEKLSFKLFDDNWTTIQDLLMLEALEIFGYGNWQEISKHIQGKSSDQVEQHFLLCY